MDKQKIIRLILVLLSVLLFLFLFISSTKKAVREVSKKANASVQIFADTRAQVIFNREVFKNYYSCKKRAKKNKSIHNYTKYCSYIVDEAAIPDNGYLTKISRKFYHYNWLSETFSTKDGRLVYKMTNKDKYLKTSQCLFMLLKKIATAFCLDLLLSGLFYFVLIFLKSKSGVWFKTVRSKIICAVLILMALCWYFTFTYSLPGEESGVGTVMLNGSLDSSMGDISLFVKFIITIFAGLLVVKESRVCKHSLWVILFSVIIIIYNPIVPVTQALVAIKMSHIVNILCEIFFIVYLVKEYKSYNT